MSLLMPISSQKDLKKQKNFKTKCKYSSDTDMIYQMTLNDDYHKHS